MKLNSPACSRLVVVTALTSAVLAAMLVAQAPGAPVPKSKAHAKELVDLLKGQKLEVFASRDPADAARFVAVLFIPGVQLLVISATYDSPSDMEYRLYQKDYMGLYTDLNSSVQSKARVFVEDSGCDGLNPRPTADEGRDSVTVGTERRTFDGDFADPKKKKDSKKISQEDYMNAFVEADERYDKLLTILVEALRKVG